MSTQTPLQQSLSLAQRQVAEVIAERRALADAINRLDASMAKVKRMKKISIASAAVLIAELVRDKEALQRVLTKHY